jgi:hypothetical protein
MTFTKNSQIVSGKRDAVRHKSGARLPTPAGAEGANILMKSWPKARCLPGCFTGGVQFPPVLQLKVGGVWGGAPRLLRLLVLPSWRGKQ